MKKNIIMVVADEMRADCVGFWGSPVAKTPVIDRLAGAGTVFMNHFSNHGKCVPARACMYTGQYANTGGHRSLGVMIQPGEENLASHLKANGYETAMFMRNHTVDESYHGVCFDHWGRAPIDNDRNHFRRAGGCTVPEEKAFYWGKIEDEDYVSSDRIHAELFCEWLSARDSGKPFFANINFINPHPPYNAPEAMAELFPLDEITPFTSRHASPGEPDFMKRIRQEYGGLDEILTQDLKKKILQCYYAQILEVDTCLGLIEQQVKDLGLWDETIVLFISDHGDYAGQYDLVEKWDTGFHDCLLHVPFFLSGGALPFGFRTVSALTEHVDLLPTLCELVGVQPPYGIHGTSLVPLITVEAGQVKESVFAEGGHEDALLEIPIPPDKHNAYIPCYQGKASVRYAYPETLRKAKMIRTEDYKYVHRVTGQHELYDLKADPMELTNLAEDSSFAEICDRMKDRLLEHLIRYEKHQPFDPHPIA